MPDYLSRTRGWFRADARRSGRPASPARRSRTCSARCSTRTAPSRDPQRRLRRRDLADDSPYRAAALARAHNDWLRDHWLDAEPRFARPLLVPGAGSRSRPPRRSAAPPWTRASCRCCCAAAASARTAIPATSRSSRPRRVRPAGHDPLRRRGPGPGRAVRAAPGMPTFYIEWHTLGSACSIMAHLVSLLCHGIFDRLPALACCCSRAASRGCRASSGASTRTGAGCARRSPWLRERPSDIVRAHVRFTTQPLEHTDGHDDLLCPDARGRGRARHPLLRVRLPALGLRRPASSAAPAARGLARRRHARQRRGLLRRAPGAVRA